MIIFVFNNICEHLGLNRIEPLNKMNNIKELVE